MTIIEAITQIDTLKPNGFKQPEKIRWLSLLDGVIKAEIIDTHEGGSEVTFTGYDESTPLDTKLLVPAPYEHLYLRWLESQIDYHNAEIGKFNNSISLYNTAYSAFEKYYNRTHMPIQHKLKFF